MKRIRTRAGNSIEDLILSEAGNFVTIVWDNGWKKPVCVAADSGIALIWDVVNAV